MIVFKITNKSHEDLNMKKKMNLMKAGTGEYDFIIIFIVFHFHKLHENNFQLFPIL